MWLVLCVPCALVLLVCVVCESVCGCLGHGRWWCGSVDFLCFTCLCEVGNMV